MIDREALETAAHVDGRLDPRVLRVHVHDRLPELGDRDQRIGAHPDQVIVVDVEPTIPDLITGRERGRHVVHELIRVHLDGEVRDADSTSEPRERRPVGEHDVVPLALGHRVGLWWPRGRDPVRHRVTVRTRGQTGHENDPLDPELAREPDRVARARVRIVLARVQMVTARVHRRELEAHVGGLRTQLLASRRQGLQTGHVAVGAR